MNFMHKFQKLQPPA